jgi:hypothetical protein
MRSITPENKLEDSGGYGNWEDEDKRARMKCTADYLVATAVNQAVRVKH